MCQITVISYTLDFWGIHMLHLFSDDKFKVNRIQSGFERFIKVICCLGKKCQGMSV